MDLKVGKMLADWSIGQVMQAVNISFNQSLQIITSTCRLLVITVRLTHMLSHEGMLIPMHALYLYVNVSYATDVSTKLRDGSL